MAIDNIWEYDASTPANNSTIGSISVAEGCAPANLNNALRELCAQARRLCAQGSAITAAATTNIGATGTSFYVHISGATGITSFGTANAGVWRLVVFDSTPAVTYNATSMMLAGDASRTYAAGDVSLFASEGSGNWRELFYQPNAGYLTASNIPNDTITYAKIQNVSAASRLLGRGSAGGAGDVEEISLGTGISMSTTTLSATGKLAQVVRDSDATYTTCSTDLPIDNSIPQSSEGDEILSVAITPTNASSTIRIRATAMVGAATGSNGGLAIFSSGSASAISATAFEIRVTTSLVPVTLEVTESAASTSARTYSVRVGPAVGGAASVYVNGDASSRIFGGVAKATLEVEELLP